MPDHVTTIPRQTAGSEAVDNRSHSCDNQQAKRKETAVSRLKEVVGVFLASVEAQIETILGGSDFSD